MNAEIWRSEIVTYGFIILNGMAVILGFVWAWKRGLMEDLDDTMRTALGITPEPETGKENRNG